MGIRFFCPNGHKLNVKEHLAGKAGFCPECGARLIIPLQSTRKSSKELAEGASTFGNLDNLHEQPEPPKETPQISSQIPALSLDDIAASSELAATNNLKPVELSPPLSAAAQQDDGLNKGDVFVKTPDPLQSTINPILQDQSVVWYIQVPGGQQYGPASGDVVHSWIKEHRISATMLLWREGWTNWLEAKNVFPELEERAELGNK